MAAARIRPTADNVCFPEGKLGATSHLQDNLTQFLCCPNRFFETRVQDLRRRCDNIFPPALYAREKLPTRSQPESESVQGVVGRYGGARVTNSSGRLWKWLMFSGGLIFVACFGSQGLSGNEAGVAGCGGGEELEQTEAKVVSPHDDFTASLDDLAVRPGILNGTNRCQVGDFPKLIAYRSMSNKGDQLDVSTSFYTSGGLGPYYETLHDVDIDKLNTIESSPRKNCYTSIYHGWFGQFGALSSDARWVFPGHWMFAKGTTVSADLNSTSDKIYVADKSVFTDGTYAMLHRKYASGDTDYGLVSKWDGHDWRTVEYVKVTTTDTGGEYIEVERNRTPRDKGTTYMYADARSWAVANTEGAAHIAPLAFRTADIEAYHDAWRINFALNSPQAEIPSTHDLSLDTGASTSTVNGLRGWEFYAYYSYLQTFKTQGKGLLEGIQFDEAQYMAGDVAGTSPYHAADIDNDLSTDFGYDSTGLNSYGVGTVEAMKLLRKLLTDNGHSKFILQADSSTVEHGYRGFDFLNGIEIENYPDFGVPKKWSKAWYENFSRFSSAIQHLLTYVEETGKTQYPAFSYPHTKEATYFYQAETLELDGTISSSYVSDNYYFRIGFMSALIAGMPHSYNVNDHQKTQKS